MPQRNERIIALINEAEVNRRVMGGRVVSHSVAALPTASSCIAAERVIAAMESDLLGWCVRRRTDQSASVVDGQAHRGPILQLKQEQEK